jgi:2-polyprenyl-3-methyl-5-hydroxy-6-metoxy-1,4-benzoquinol methylase
MWNERYQAPGFAYGTEPNDFLVEVEPMLPRHARVLSLAEGEGRNAVWLAQQGHQVVAVDGSSVGLDKALTLAQQRGVVIETVVADLQDFAIDVGAFDAIVSIWAHVPPALRVALHARCVAGLRPGGRFILEAYTPAQTARTTGGPRDPSMCMSPATLTAELAGLSMERCEEKVRMVHEGAFHEGDSDVVQCVARHP